MKSNRNVYTIYFALCGLLAVVLLFSGGGPSSDADLAALPEPGPGGSGNEADLSALMMGGGGGGARAEGGSIFESQFFNEHRPDTEEELEKVNEDGSPEILEPAHPHNPVNPQTGLPYPDKLMNRFKELRKRFPGNKVIPMRLSPEEKAAKQEKNRQDFLLRSKVKQGRASEEEINQHFDNEVRGIKDRLEILEYIMERQNKHMSPEIKKQYDKILARNKQQMESIESQRESAISKSLE